MKGFRLDGSWPAVMVVALFLLIPLTTLPGLFDFFFVVLMVATALLAVLIVVSIATSRGRREEHSSGGT
ncbi:MAG: hypothetical protein ACK4WM_07310 [Thermoflexales bacterium]